MNQYEARWNNAVRIANKINELIKEGNIIFNDDSEPCNGFIIRKDGIFQKVSANSSYIFFLKDKEFDNGYHTTIKEYNEQFKDWYYVNPKDYKSISGVINDRKS
jgi:hypothetical protein